MPTTFNQYENTHYGYQYTTTILTDMVDIGYKKKSGIRYYLRCIKWLWKNRDWANTRQKFKAMDKECNL